MAFNFPSSPAQDQLYSPPGGPTYIFKSPVWIQLTGSEVDLSGLNYRRNRITNGAFRISQELEDTGTGASGAYFADQWALAFGGAGLSIGSYRASGIIAPSGNDKRGIINVITGKPSFGAAEYCWDSAVIEGFDMADFQWGTLAAKQAILRFTVRFPVAGTFCVCIRNDGVSRSWIGTFTIDPSEVGVDVVRTLVVPGDTTGTWNKNNQVGAYVSIVAHAGSTYQGVAGWQAGNRAVVAGSTNAAAVAQTIHITDVGLYIDHEQTGSPPKYEVPSYDDELRECSRYYQLVKGSLLHSYSPTGGSFLFHTLVIPVQMRAVPSVGLINPVYNNMSGLAVNGSTESAVQVRGTVTAAGFSSAQYTAVINSRM